MNSRKRIAGLDPAAFMRRHWQREPLLLRGAFADFADPLSPRQVLALATSDETSARLVKRRGKRWSLEHGPFDRATLAALPARDWTVLVQDTNHFADAPNELLAHFDFIPHARIDDVMVSYAVPGGGVGPHVDSYDVFLLQGRGRRRWRISRQRDLRHVPGQPLKILADFRHDAEWVLEAGDMLYLPPGVAHEGVAESECLTWSIGFRAPSDDEIAKSFVDHLRDTLALDGHYGDRGAKPARHPGELPAAMLSHVARTVARIRWNGGAVAQFAGCLLTEPKASVVFEPPARPLPRAAFLRSARRRGLSLDRRARFGFSGRMFFMNGEPVHVPAEARNAMRRLADARGLAAPCVAEPAFWDLAHAWYRRGFVVLAGKEET